MFGIFQNIFRKNHDEARIKEGLMKAQEKYYMPYTKKMLDSGISLIPNKGLPKNMMAALARNGVTGEARAVHYDPKCSTNAYSFYNMIEHEAVHFDQRPEKFYSLKILSGIKHRQIVELEAYGQNTYMFLHDYASGLLTKREVRTHLANSQYVSTAFFQAYTQRDSEVTDDLKTLKTFKGRPLEKSEEECFGHFFYRLSFSKEVMNFFKKSELDMTALILSDVDNQEAVSSFKKEIGGRRLFEQNYTFENAKNELHRNGNKYLDVLNEKQKKEFWENICTLTPQEQAEMATLNGRAKMLIKACV